MGETKSTVLFDVALSDSFWLGLSVGIDFLNETGTLTGRADFGADAVDFDMRGHSGRAESEG